MLDVCIFSKDRAQQLDLLLSSMRDKFPVVKKIGIIYKYSNELSHKAYRKCFDYHKHFQHLSHFRDQSNIPFEEALKVEVGNFKNHFCLFLCDDNVFINDVDYNEFLDVLSVYNLNNKIHSFSLRMSPKVDYCFPAKKRMRKPGFRIGAKTFTWNWRQAKDQHTCWGYPMAINTHVYKTKDIRPVILEGSYENVNSLEAHINRRRWKNKLLMIAFREPKIFDVCNNYVRDGSVPTKMIERFLKGERIIDIDKNQDDRAHGEVEFLWR